MVRDYLYVSDLVDALELAASARTQHKVFNIGSGQGTSLNALIAFIADVTGEQPNVKYLPGRPLDVPTNVLDVSRAQQELGWSPRTELAEGISRTWDWIRALTENQMKEEV